tara:strand:- start:1271 stop:1972 length:702 start_codon:yes stop_codon:yes gene_type:complete
MATFVKGDHVQITPQVDWQWDQWSEDHTEFCEKVCTIAEVKYEQWTDQIYIHVEHRGKRLWFLDRHAIKVKNYHEVYSEAIRAAAQKLNETEQICKKLRDEMLSEVFGVDYTSDDEETVKDELYDDWEEVTTKEVVSLPGNGGTMTTPTNPKDTADANRSAVRKIKSLGKKISKKKTSVSGSLSSAWTLTDEDLQELQDYIDTLPGTDNISTSRDIDFGYNFDDDYEGDGNGD